MAVTTSNLSGNSKRESSSGISQSKSIKTWTLHSSWLDIAANSICLTLPLILLTTALITYVLVYQVRSDLQGSALLVQNNTIPDDNAFYVDTDSTMLVFLASWMSSVAPLLTGCAVALATYPVARQLLDDTQAEDRIHFRPTPFEFHIMLKVIGGSCWGALWALILYVFGWKQRMNRQSAALTTLLAVMAAALFLSVAVLGADTWLHIATTTVALTRIVPLAKGEATYSFTVSPQCTMTNNSLAALQEAGLSCTINGTTNLLVPVLETSAATMETVNNQSRTTAVLQMPGSDISYLSPVPDSVDPSFDFLASTFGVSTQCKPHSQACNLVNNGNVTFNCGDGAFYSEGSYMNSQGLMTQVSMAPDLSDMTENLDLIQYYGIKNNFYVTAITINAVPFQSPLRQDPEIVAPRYVLAAIFLCNLTILDLEYAVRNGRPYIVASTPSNTSVTNMFSSGITAIEFGYDNMRAAMNMAAFVAVDAQDLANRFAVTISHTLLSVGAGSVHRSPVTLVQQRKSMLVARVPKPPFFLLTSINVGYVVLGFLLAVIASTTSHEVRQVQYRLTTAGVVADLLDREHARNHATTIEELYGEYHGSDHALRVGVDRTSKGGFAFNAVAFRPGLDQTSRDTTTRTNESGPEDEWHTVGNASWVPRFSNGPFERIAEDLSPRYMQHI